MRTLARRIAMIERRVPPVAREQQINARLRDVLGCGPDDLTDAELGSAAAHFCRLAEVDPDGGVDVLELRRHVFGAAAR